ncbi:MULTISPECIES: glucosaminidase domain-containing protein [Gammaproteobacteria]|uniref:glucosaminidase domain-containing protein n=1 Tax=Gammaproteobacteria TaxID=1236 RepID=UPI0014028B58|nr:MULTISPECIES: glucosaminidase domain-containing protein [Gammaproteobacteria]
MDSRFKWGALCVLGIVAFIAVFQMNKEQSSEIAPGEQTQNDGAPQSLEEQPAETMATSPAGVLPDVRRPPATATTEVPEFGEIFNIRERKEAFFSYLLPAIRDENERIRRQRRALLRLQAKYHTAGLSMQEQRWVSQLAEYYDLDTEVNEETLPEVLTVLERRVDVIPETLVLVQAANESGWGRSRFAQSARNFFGQWCWSQGCGIVPSQRPDGQVYEVRLFDSMEASIRSYMRNLNTHYAYQDLRGIREQMRAAEEPITATPLTEGLTSYSERGEEYVEELQQMIRVNQPIIENVGETLSAEGS